MDASLYTVSPAIAGTETSSPAEAHIVVNPDRTITVPDCLKDIAVLLDHSIETVTFDCIRYWDGHDLSTMHVYVHYRCANGTTGAFPCENVVVTDDDSGIMHFDWTISDNVTCAVGAISFLVCVKESATDGTLKRRFSSRLNQDMRVLEGLGDPSDDIVSRYPDVIEYILNRLDSTSGSAPAGIYIGDEEPEDESVVVWFDTSEGGSAASSDIKLIDAVDGKTYTVYVSDGSLMMEETTSTTMTTRAIKETELIDRETGTAYYLYVENGKLKMHS